MLGSLLYYSYFFNTLYLCKVGIYSIQNIKLKQQSLVMVKLSLKLFFSVVGSLDLNNLHLGNMF